MSDLHDAHETEEMTIAPVETDWIPVLFARDGMEATWYCSILEEARIPALAGDAVTSESNGRGKLLSRPILVPLACHERASEIIALREAVLSDGEDDDDDVFDDDDEEDDENEDENEEDDDDDDDEEDDDEEDFFADDPEDDCDDEDQDQDEDDFVDDGLDD